MSNVHDALTKAAKRQETIRPLTLSWQGISCEWRIMVLIFGLLFVAIVNQLRDRALRAQIDERAVVIAANLSDAATGHVINKDVLQLKTSVISTHA